MPHNCSSLRSPLTSFIIEAAVRGSCSLSTNAAAAWRCVRAPVRYFLPSYRAARRWRSDSASCSTASASALTQLVPLASENYFPALLGTQGESCALRFSICSPMGRTPIQSLYCSTDQD